MQDDGFHPTHDYDPVRLKLGPGGKGSALVQCPQCLLVHRIVITQPVKGEVEFYTAEDYGETVAARQKVKRARKAGTS